MNLEKQREIKVLYSARVIIDSEIEIETETLDVRLDCFGDYCAEGRRTIVVLKYLEKNENDIYCWGDYYLSPCKEKLKKFMKEIVDLVVSDLIAQIDRIGEN